MLLAVENVWHFDQKGMFEERRLAKVSVRARVFDIKTKKETMRSTVFDGPVEEREVYAARDIGIRPINSHCYFNSKSEPRVVFAGKIYDAANGKTVHEFDPGRGVQISRDGRYLVRLPGSTADKKKIGIEIWSIDQDK